MNSVHECVTSHHSARSTKVESGKIRERLLRGMNDSAKCAKPSPCSRHSTMCCASKLGASVQSSSSITRDIQPSGQSLPHSLSQSSIANGPVTLSKQGAAHQCQIHMLTAASEFILTTHHVHGVVYGYAYMRSSNSLTVSCLTQLPSQLNGVCSPVLCHMRVAGRSHVSPTVKRHIPSPHNLITP